MQTRNQSKINYKIFHTTGEKVLCPSGESSKMDQIIIEIETLDEDIKDFMDENQISNNGIQTLQEVEAICIKIADLRTEFRKKHKQLKKLCTEYDELYAGKFNEVLLNIKSFINDGSDIKQKMRIQDFRKSETMKNCEDDQVRFIADDINRQLQDVEEQCEVDLSEVTNEEILQRKDGVNNLRKKLDNISIKITKLLSYEASQGDGNVYDTVKRYEKISSDLSGYEAKLKIQNQSREIEKETLFKQSKLNISLGKFGGYNSVTDVYTFHDDFEKLYGKSTPRRLKPDLLKNNYLENPALSLVKFLEDIDEIWDCLKKSYGDPKLMLSKKMKSLQNLECVWKCKNSDKIIQAFSKIINVMKELMKLAEKHEIKGKLYNSDALEFIYKAIGESRLNRWLSLTCDDDLEDEELWLRLIQFLEKELKIQQQKGSLVRKSEPQSSPKHAHFTGNDSQQNQKAPSVSQKLKCAICGEPEGVNGHVSSTGASGIKLLQYFTCKKFVEMTPYERFGILLEKNLCFQCLYPNASMKDPKHKKGYCQHAFTCQHTSHSKYPSKKHILVCEEHKEDQSNNDLLQLYKERFILKKSDAPSHAKSIQLSFHTSNDLVSSHMKVNHTGIQDDIIKDRGVYLLQTIKINDQHFTIFFDNGCCDFLCRKSAVDRLGDRAAVEFKGVINLGGVGGISIQTNHGIYTVSLPLVNGRNAIMSGVCLEKITEPFPTYPLSQVEEDIRTEYSKQNGNLKKLPKLPAAIGGEVDFIIGVKYLRYHPSLIFQLSSGLSMYESVFQNADGGRGVVGGPHNIFTNTDSFFSLTKRNQSTYLCDQLSSLHQQFSLKSDLPLLGYKESDELFCQEKDVYVSRKIKLFTQVEETGTIINYRCISCRNCKACKEHDSIEEMSIREEAEQEIINKSVKVNLDTRSTVATLPLLHDPITRLSPNKEIAMKVFQQQLKKLDRNEKDKIAVIKSEGKLQDLGFVEYVKNLSSDQQKNLKESPIQNFFPWRAVYKDNSVSTPCRLVFDASQPTNSGYSLNDLLCKGKNSMNKLQEILIRWMVYKVGFHTDIQKMYNSVKLMEKDWCFQRYLWQEKLDSKEMPEEKVIKTLIYGVKSSGNQAEYGIRKTADLSKQQFPEVFNIINKDIYVDDCLSGEQTVEDAKQRADELEIVLGRGGYKLKGITFSKEEPPDNLSDNGVNVSVAGMLWYPKSDELALDIGELSFARKIRGRKVVTESSKKIPERLTRRHCASKMAEVYDLTGKVSPIICSLKLDLRELVQRKLDWDDVLPDSLRNLWISNFEMIQELKNLRFNRAVIPEDAISTDISTLDFGDATMSVACCVAIYARFKRRNGQYSCQLILSRTKLIEEGTNQPRSELVGALLNAHTGHIVKRSLGRFHKDHLKITDSEIVLYWLVNHEKPLKQWTRNRVVEILRFTSTSDWRHVDSSNMIADKGTRRGVKVEEVGKDSVWINGFPWMRLETSEMPLKTVNEIQVNDDQAKEAKKEFPISSLKEVYTCDYSINKTEIKKRYEFSKYLIDPMKFSFNKVVRIIGYVYKFINSYRKKISTRRSSSPSSEEIGKSERYFFIKGTLEVKEFYKSSFYNNFTREKDGLLMYSGRILSTDNISVSGRFTNAMKDLTNSTYCVPVLDKHSPIAYSIINEIHWNDKDVQHRGIETVWRQVLKYVFIIEGRSLVKAFRKRCLRCRYLQKKTIDVAMGPLSDYNLVIAPAFFATQVDLAGPFLSYSNHHKRTVVKIWIAVFCCCTTTTVNMKVMEDYSSNAFVQAVIRFSCEVGYPKYMLPDEGSQLLSTCEKMMYNYKDVQNQLFVNAKMQFEACPVGAHNMHGRVERKIREIKSSIQIKFDGIRLSILQWETICAEVSNSINDMPLALGSQVSDFELSDLITPNRLRLGRNNQRSPDGVMKIEGNLTMFLKQNEKIFESWFEGWLMSHLPKLMYQPKWFSTSNHLKEGDIVLFTKQDSVMKVKYQYGIVESVSRGKDNLVRKAIIKYRNNNEKSFRTTNRSVRELIVIHPVDELNIISEINEVSLSIDAKFKSSQ